MHVNDEITRSGKATGNSESLNAWETGDVRPNLSYVVPGPRGRLSIWPVNPDTA